MMVALSGRQGEHARADRGLQPCQLWKKGPPVNCRINPSVPRPCLDGIAGHPGMFLLCDVLVPFPYL